MKPVNLYFDKLPTTATFADLMLLAQKRDEEACIGVKIGVLASDAERNYGVELIPLKDKTFELVAGDSLIAVAEDER